MQSAIKIKDRGTKLNDMKKQHKNSFINHKKMIICRLLSVVCVMIRECSCSTLKIEALTSPIQHGEGPHWDQKNNVLYFVDTFQATAYRLKLDPAENKLEYQKLEGRDSIGIIVPIKDTKDQFVIAADRYLYKLTWKADQNDILGLTQIEMVELEKHKNQFNDGKADAKGRLWIGTLTREEDLSVSETGGALYRFEGGKLVSKQIDNTCISNGIAWSEDNTRFYFVDTGTRNVIEYEHDFKSGNLGRSKVLFDLNDHPNIKGALDGMTIDNNDNLWIALFGGHGVINVDGRTGELLRFVELPASYCTSACFGGPNLDILYVTTSRLKLNDEEQKIEDQAGCVFAIKNLGVSGPAPYDCVI